jgi:hypothetical protein
MKKRVYKSGQVWVEAKNIFLRFLHQPSWKNKNAQVWVETVIYTLIVLTIIGLFLSFARPKIEEMQDKSIIEQSIGMLEQIDGIISNIVQGGAGNQRVVEIGIKKGNLEIDSVNDQIVFEIDGRYAYTEPGLNGQKGDYVQIGKVLVTTENRGEIKRVTLISNYSNIYNVTYQMTENSEIITKAPNPQSMTISNKGGSLTQIDFDI